MRDGVVVCWNPFKGVGSKSLTDAGWLGRALHAWRNALMADARPTGIACGSCGTVLPLEWVNEPRDQRSPCPKCRGTQRRTAIAKSNTSPPPNKPRGLLARIGAAVRRGTRPR